MIRYSYLEKSDFEKYSSVLFGILADNMSVIAPTGNSREEDFAIWFNAVNEGLRNPKRQIILFHYGESIIGFFQYCTNEDTFLMEEIQITAIYQGKYNIFRGLYQYLLPKLDSKLLFVEAYANKLNVKSDGILSKLGLKVVGTNKKGDSYHYRGDYQNLMEVFFYE